MLENNNVYSKNAIKEIILSLFLYLILPISSLIIAFVLYRRKWAKYFFMLFGLFFGFTFIVPSSKVNDAYDSEFYALQLEEYHNNDISFKKLVSGFYSVETLQTDIYQPLVTWCVSVFTDNYNILFALYGLIFSIFLAKIIWFMIEMSNIELKGFMIVLLFTFVLINPLWNINGVRMWTALNIFLYGIILFFFKNKTKGTIYILLTCLVHVSFLIPVMFLIIYLLISKIGNKTFFISFLFSFLLKGIPPSILSSLSDYLPAFVRYKLDFYTDPNTVSLVTESVKNTSLFISLSQFSQSFIPFLIVVYLQFFYIKQIKTSKYILFFNYLLFTVFWVNMSSIIPSFGRYQAIYLMLSMFFLFINLKELKMLPYFKIFKLLLIPCFILIIVQKLREFIDFQGIYLFIGNYFTYFFVSNPEPIVNSFLK